MKFRIPLVFAFLNLIPQVSFGTVWWPEVKSISPNITIYKDYDDANQFYYIPRSIEPAQTDEAVRMINHGLFFNRLNPGNSVTQYNLTFQPVLADAEVLNAERILKSTNPNASLSPLPITTTSFEVTQKNTTQDQISTPFTVSVPSWTGDLHSFNQRFTVIMRGNAFAAEPAMSRFMTNRASNAFAGTMHYGFRGVQIPFEGHAVVNVHQFMSKFRAHASARFGFWGSMDIATAIDKIKDDQSVFVSVKKDAGYESEVWKSIIDKMISKLFQPVPPAPDAPSGSGSGLFQLSAAYSQVSSDQKITIDLKEAITKDHTGDIDITGGGINPESLDKNIKYLCDMWAKYDSPAGHCVDVCTPGLEYYNPSTHACSAAFGGPSPSNTGDKI